MVRAAGSGLPGAALLALLSTGDVSAQTLVVSEASAASPAGTELPRPRLLAELEPSPSARPFDEALWPARLRPGEAFRAELRDEAIEYRFTNRWAFADESLQGDRPVREGRARAAENILGDAAGAAMEVVLRRAFDRPKKERVARPGRDFSHGLRVDSRPSWRIRTQAGLTHLRLDLPLSAHSDIALRCTRSLDSPRKRREFGASFRINPWDESVSFGFELEF